MSVLTHAHDCLAELPERLPSHEIKDLSQIENRKALLAIAGEWLAIAGAICLCLFFWHPLVYILAVMFIGARQHALLILLHDASHFILLSNRKWNNWLGNVLLGWPNFVTVQGFRCFHSEHHRHLNTELDSNRELWDTHNEFGELKDWLVFPKTVAGMIGVLAQRVLMGTGIFWIFRGFMAMLLPSARSRTAYPLAQAVAQMVFYVFLAAVITWFGFWSAFLLYWIVPYCTWHVLIQYIRIICEHSAVQADVAPFDMTRTTIPRFWERVFVLPRNIGYHHEHHWYPGVPFYNLPELHRRLVRKTCFGQYANVNNSVVQSLGECVRERHFVVGASGPEKNKLLI